MGGVEAATEVGFYYFFFCSHEITEQSRYCLKARKASRRMRCETTAILIQQGLARRARTPTFTSTALM